MAGSRNSAGTVVVAKRKGTRRLHKKEPFDSLAGSTAEFSGLLAGDKFDNEVVLSRVS
jgi:ATP-dependent protease HslVU (ClpYQ) peptidase subunit